MERRHHLDTMIRVPYSPEAGNRRFRLQQRLCSKSAKRDDNARFDEIKLFHEKWLTGSNFIWLRVPVLGWPTFHHISDVDVLPPHLHPFGDDLGEELSSPPNERFTFKIFVTSRTFTNKGEFGPWITDTKHDLCPPFTEFTPLTVADLSPQFL
jgi:hypothetical protein